jgi:hypothetical protein
MDDMFICSYLGLGNQLGISGDSCNGGGGTDRYFRLYITAVPTKPHGVHRLKYINFHKTLKLLAAVEQYKYCGPVTARTVGNL